MAIPRKPNKNQNTVENFIQKPNYKSEKSKIGRKIISLSLLESDAIWVNDLLDKINRETERKVTRSEIISAAISILRKKGVNNVIQLIKNR